MKFVGCRRLTERRVTISIYIPMQLKLLKTCLIRSHWGNFHRLFAITFIINFSIHII